MLTPTQLDKLPEPMIKLMAELQDDIISDICRRITKANLLTPTAEWQLEKANQLTLSSREVKKRIAAKLKVQEKLVKELYTEAVRTAIDEDAKIYKMAIAEGILSDNYREKLTTYTRSVAFSNAVKRGLKNTNGLMRNLTNSAAAAANRQLSDALDLAYLKVASGAFTPQDAIFEAVKKLGAEGIKCVNYASGRSDQLDVAVRRAVVTGIGKTCCDLQLDLANEMDCQLVEVSSHLGARPSHAEWQGKIYSLVKGHPRYPYFYEATGYGTGDGLGGWNCRHSFFPYFEGLSSPANAPDFTKSENEQVYNDTQKQRSYERAIRQSKRELAALDSARKEASPELKAKLDREFERKSVTLKNREARLAEHLKATGLLPDNSRVRVDGFGRSVSQKAVWANKHTTVVKDGKYTYYPITNKSITDVRLVTVNGLTDTQCKQLRKAHRELLKEARKYPVGTETSITYDLDMNINSNGYIKGEIGKVGIYNHDYEYIAIHNHPSDAMFSYGDIRNFAYNPYLKILTVVGNKGSVYVLNKTDLWDDIGFGMFVEDVYAKYPDYDTSIQSRIKCVNEILKGAKKYGIQYQKAINR